MQREREIGTKKIDKTEIRTRKDTSTNRKSISKGKKPELNAASLVNCTPQPRYEASPNTSGQRKHGLICALPQPRAQLNSWHTNLTKLALKRNHQKRLLHQGQRGSGLLLCARSVGKLLNDCTGFLCDIGFIFDTWA